ncbi:MAG: serine hydrolase [Rhodobacteraceae bacterium]|nr:serine hydrolase [Paracoccaceae bacterium]
MTVAFKKLLKLGTAMLAMLAAAYLVSDWRFWVRHFQSPGDDRIIFDFNWYEPRARVGEGPGRDIPVAAPNARAIDQAALEAVTAYARELDSYAFIVAQNGVIQAEYYKDGFGPESMFDTQSMHKGLLGVAFGLAVDHGLIDTIDKPAAAYITEWANDARNKIAIRDLLANTSGLADPGFSEWPWSVGYRLFIGTHVDDAVIALPAVREPGREFQFNHVNSQILHAVLTRATGMTYVDFLKTYLWDPLGNGAAQVRLDEPDGSARTVCCFQTTARSWLRIANMILAGGQVNGAQVLSQDWIKEMTTATPVHPKTGFHILLGQPAPPRRTYAATDRAQPTRASEPFAADDVRYLEGRGGQRTLWIPSKKIAVVRIGKIDFAWDDAKVINPLIAGLKAPERSADGE